MASYYGDKSRDVPSWDSLDRADEDEIVRSEYQYANRDHVLFCIDASTTMQRPQADERNEMGLIRGKSALHQVLEAVVKIEKGKVITGPADSVGLILYNVDPEKSGQSSSGNYKPGTYVYQNLQTINAEEIKKVIKLMEAANEEYLAHMEEDEDIKTVQPEILTETFPPCSTDKELNIADVLVTCNFIFRDAGSRMNGNKRVFLVTDNDEPPGSSSTRQAARTTSGDLDTYGITINTFFVDRPGHRFNPTIYWNDILNRDDSEDDPVGKDPDEEGLRKLQEIMNDLVIKQAPKRVQFSIPLKLGGKEGDIEIGVSGYSLISEQGKGAPKYVRMRGQTVEEVVTRSEYTSAETGAVLRQEEIGHAYQFGNESTVKNVLEPNWWESDKQIQANQMVADEVLKRDEERRRRRDEGEEDEVMEDARSGDQAGDGPSRTTVNRNGTGNSDEKPKVVARTRLRFTDSEVAEMRSLGITPQIKILGFQASDLLQIDETIKHSYFIYPDESAYSGSTRTFSALLQSCTKFDKHALALCRFKRNNTPEFAVLIPQAEEVSEDGKSQDTPPGFHVVVLPFRDDIRAPPKNMTGSVDVGTSQQVLMMEKIVTRLKSRYGSYNPDAYPNPALAYHYAQLQALAFEEDFDPSDPDAIAELDKTLPKHGGMHKIAGKYMEAWNNAIREDERAVETLKGGTKRAAQTVQVDESELADVEASWRKGTMDKMKVADLKEWAKFHQISLTGKTKKADMIEAISDHLEKNATGKKSKTS